jgi:transcription elongation factor SPT4
MIAVMSPEDSWVCKWQRTSENNIPLHELPINSAFSSIDRFTKGVYAISVSGRIPNSVVREMKSRGITYRSRDTSQR